MNYYELSPLVQRVLTLLSIEYGDEFVDICKLYNTCAAHCYVASRISPILYSYFHHDDTRSCITFSITATFIKRFVMLPCDCKQPREPTAAVFYSMKLVCDQFNCDILPKSSIHKQFTYRVRYK